MKPQLVMIALTLISIHSSSQSLPTQMGARAMGMGFATAAVSDEWSASYNPAGLATMNDITIGLTYESTPTFPSFNRAALAVVIPFPVTKFGLTLYRFGDDLYNEQVAGISAANKFGIASLGLRVNYIQYNIEGFGSATMVSASFGGIAEISPTIRIGAAMDNIYSPDLARSGEQLPTRLQVNLTFVPSSALSLSTELEKDLDHRVLAKLGLESSVHQKFLFRLGCHLYPAAAFAGFGFKRAKLRADYGARFFNASGFAHQATVSFNLSKK